METFVLSAIQVQVKDALIELLTHPKKKTRIRGALNALQGHLQNQGHFLSIGTINYCLKRFEKIGFLDLVATTSPRRPGKSGRPAYVWEFKEKKFNEIQLLPEGTMRAQQLNGHVLRNLQIRKANLVQKIAYYEHYLQASKEALEKVEKILKEIEEVKGPPSS